MHATAQDSVSASEQRPVWAWIDRRALAHNARRALACADGRVVIGVVKADGYGHGAETVAKALLAEGVGRLAVVSVAEGAALRRAGIGAPILLLGGLDDAAAAERAVKWALTPVLHDVRSFELASAFGRADAPLAVEVEVDTAMSRMGVPAGSARALLSRVVAAPQLALTGVFTHLACADEPDPTPSLAQIARFAEVLGEWRDLTVERRAGEAGEPAASTAAAPILHVANSAGLLRLAELEAGAEGTAAGSTGLRTTAVRPGLMLYGVSPLSGGEAEGEGSGARSPCSAAALDLAPVMTLAGRVVAVRRIERGTPVGYGGEWRAPRATTIATLPLGYADGIPRAAFGRGTVWLAGRPRPIVGRVSMDSVCVEVAEGGVEVGQVATFFGRTPEGERVPVERFAEQAGTIGYEILVGVGARVPRQVGDGPPHGV